MQANQTPFWQHLLLYLSRCCLPSGQPTNITTIWQSWPGLWFPAVRWLAIVVSVSAVSMKIEVGIGRLLLVPYYLILNQVYGFSTCRSWIKNVFTKAAFLQLITGMPLRKPTPERGAGKRILNSLHHLRKKRRHARYLMQVFKMQFDICCGLYSSSFRKLFQVWEWNGSLRSWKDCYS